MLRKIATIVFFSLICAISWAQPANLEGNWSGSWDNNNALIDRGSVRSYRAQAGTTGNADFLFNTASGNYNPQWTGSNAPNYTRSLNTVHSGGAFYYTTGGWNTNLQISVVNSRYYTWIIGENSGSNNTVSILETTFNPRTISSVSQDPASVGIQEDVEITITLSGALSSGEEAYIRYTTDNWATSQFAQATGSPLVATIPGQNLSTTVKYYALTTSSAITLNHADADFQSLEVNTNGGANWEYTVEEIYVNKEIGGACSGVWTDGDCWYNGSMPPNWKDVIIKNNMILDTNAWVHDLTIESGDTLTSEVDSTHQIRLGNGDTLNVAGVFIPNQSELELTGVGTLLGNLTLNDMSLVTNIGKFLDDVSLTGSLDINGNATLDFDNNDLTISGNISRGQPLGALVNMGKVTFNGDTNQYITGNVTFQDGMEINKPSGNVLCLSNGTNAGVAIENADLTLTKGHLVGNGFEVLVKASSGISGGSDSSHVIDSMTRETNATSAYSFPVGDGSTLRRVDLTPSSTSATTFGVRQYTTVINPDSVDAGVNNVSGIEMWEIDRISGSATAKVKLFWNAGSNVNTVSSDLFVAHYASGAGKWQKVTSDVPVGNVDSGSVETSSAVSSFSPFTLGSSSAPINLLPVDLVYVNAQCKGEYVQISWATATESNSSHFEIQAWNGKEFVPVQTIQGQGESREIVEYQSRVLKSQGKVFRLVQFDFDGSKEAFAPMNASCTPNHDIRILQPEGQLELSGTSLEEDYSWMLIQTTGQIVSQEEGIHGAKVIPIDHLSSGVYILSIQTKSGQVVSKRILVR